MKLFTQSIFTISVIFMGISSFAKGSFAGQSCGAAVTTEARLAADDDTGADPGLMTEECIADYGSIKSIGQNKYSVLVNCGDSPEMMYDVMVSQNGDSCIAVDATQDKSFKPAS
jgi:hypothetical protein